DLIQVGTIDTTTAHGESSSAFYELLPDNARAITHFAITPGDSMSASLSEVTTNIWKITITDVTTGQTYTTTKAYNSSGSTAEWIEEDPSASVGGQPIPLDTFTPVSFTQGNVTGLNTNNTYTTLTIAGSNAQPITLVSLSGQTATPVVTPSVLGSDGESFTVTESPTN
ncbi:MAG TPA: G1 family glutamic endopeptidase, partial [Verrucomicrobiae bacterium]|nr:G1 family glutamic endopeptidase [Verrucomicrobiae bacterium]